jgi:hypothetical protein
LYMALLLQGYSISAYTILFVCCETIRKIIYFHSFIHSLILISNFSRFTS